MDALRRIIRPRGLGIVLALLFVVILGGQAWAGYRADRGDRLDHAEEEIGFGTYLTSSAFGEAVFENWESEFLQMGAYVLLTVWLVQHGSAESKPIDEPSEVDEDPAGHRDDPDAPWPVRRGGWWLAVYRRSLSLAFFLLFAAAFVGHLVTGARAYSAEQVTHGADPVSSWTYLRSAQFWFESLQNWQSEFLAVLAIAVLSIWLRQQGSAESKPVHAPHAQTGS